MSQEETEAKKITLKNNCVGYRLLDFVLMLCIFVALYLMMALISFSPDDPSWFQATWHDSIHNFSGRVGAWLADVLFFTFGVLAYAIPTIMLFFCWSYFTPHGYLDCFTLSLRLIGILALLLTSCGIAALHINDLYYFTSGGIIGNLFSNTFLQWFNDTSTTFVLLCIWACGLTLLTGWSWLTIAQKIGVVVLDCLTFISNHSRRYGRNKHYDYCCSATEESNDVVHPISSDDYLRIVIDSAGRLKYADEEEQTY